MLNIGLYDGPGSSGGVARRLLLDLTPYAGSAVFTTNQHGYEQCTVVARINWLRAFELFNRQKVAHLVVAYGATTVWEGRVEEPGVTVTGDGSGISLAAFGYWRALSDTRYTALWSDTSYARWRELSSIERTDAFPERFEFKKEFGSLLVAPKKGEVFGTTGTFKVFWAIYEIPSGSVTGIAQIDFAWQLSAAVNWRLEVRRNGADIILGVNGSAVPQGGTVSQSIAAAANITVLLYYNAADAVYAGNTGDVFVRLSGIRVAAATPIDAGAIARALVASVSTVNPMQLSASVAGIQSTGLDLTDEVYADETPADILARLAELGDTQARRWEAVVWNDRELVFRPRLSGRTWYVDAMQLQLQRKLDGSANSMYAVYKDGDNNEVRSPVATSAAGQQQTGIVRQQPAPADTTSAATALAIRDTALADAGLPRPAASITFAAVYSAAGARQPLCLARAGDVIVIRNLPPGDNPALTDTTRRFRITRTSYDLITDTLTVEPEQPLPRLPFLLARREAGIR